MIRYSITKFKIKVDLYIYIYIEFYVISVIIYRKDITPFRTTLLYYLSYSKSQNFQDRFCSSCHLSWSLEHAQNYTICLVKNVLYLQTALKCRLLIIYQYFEMCNYQVAEAKKPSNTQHHYVIVQYNNINFRSQENKMFNVKQLKWLSVKYLIIECSDI